MNTGSSNACFHLQLSNFCKGNSNNNANAKKTDKGLHIINQEDKHAWLEALAGPNVFEKLLKIAL